MNKILFFIFLILNKVISWSCTGHMITAKIAEMVLQNTYEFDQINQSILAMNDLTDGRSNTFAESACWPDDIKDTIKFWNSWHYTNREINPDGLIVESNVEFNILNALETVQKVLKDKRAKVTSYQKATMSRFLIHLLGDLHQPLHVSTLYNNTFPTGDLGGNLFHIQTYDGKHVHLHTYWDQTFQYYDYFQRPLQQESQHKLQDYAQEIMQLYSQDDLKDDLQDQDINNWVNKEFHLCYDKVYGGFLQENTNVMSHEQYLEALGGYRLANYIKILFQSQQI